MGKGSKPRPFTVPKEQYDNNFESIFGKRVPTYLKNRIQETNTNTSTEVKDELAEYQKQAQAIWNDSCTSPRKGTQ